jgi:hypothetical protein
MGYEPLFSPGLHNWGRFFCDFRKLQKSLIPAMEAVFESGLKEVMMTMWGDDGNESLFHYACPALAFYAETLKSPAPLKENYEAKSEAIFGMKRIFADGTAALESPDSEALPAGITSKMLFYDDPLYAFAGRLAESPERVSEYYLRTGRMLTGAAGENPEASEYLLLASEFAFIIAGKLKLYCKSKALYRHASGGGIVDFTEVLQETDALIDKCVKFRRQYRRLWMRERKPFGFEVMDIRLAGVAARLETFRERIAEFADGRFSEIPEFELETPENFSVLNLNTYSKTVTKCYSIW